MPLPAPARHPRWLTTSWWTPLKADTALAVGLLTVELVSRYAGPAGWNGPQDTWTPVWAALTLVPVALRRRWLWLSATATVVFILLGAAGQQLWSGQGVALWVLAYTLAAYERWWRAMLGTVLLWAANDVVFLYAYDHAFFSDGHGGQLLPYSLGMIINLVAMIVTFLLGRTMQARRQAASALAERAAVAEANQHAHAEQAVADERRRIARELHDVVAHHVSVIGVMATGARRMMHRNPAAADEALMTIEQTSRTTLRELRRLLFVLRATADGAEQPPGSADAQLSPQPTLAGVRNLVDQVTEAGLPTALKITGDTGELDPGVALTAYRIVQEALTNTLKHAGPAHAEVRLTLDSRLLVIEVFDTGCGPHTRSGAVDSGHSAGHGLLGMRERVAVYGGTLRTGPRPGGGFRVYASIPFEKTSPTATGQRIDPSPIPSAEAAQ